MRESCIVHRPCQPIAIVRADYYKIASSSTGAAVIGFFHVGFSESRQTSTATFGVILEGILGIGAEKLLRQELKKLIVAGWIEPCELSATEVIEHLTRKQPQLFALGNRQCQWCKAITIALQKHHHPVPRSQGGKTTVDICANCHFEFHQLVSSVFYRPSVQLLARFELMPSLDLEELR